MKPIITVENLSKQYRLGTIGTGTLSHDITRWWYSILGKEDPYLMVGETNDRSVKGNSDYVWALKDINLSIQPGEVLGIIGKNGAGKSTLLKLLSRVTAPTTGKVIANGRIASLLEVGTGFHPELTGKENIFLNGAILGMTKREIREKFDEIVAFAGCERYIDTPVKRYSSGMYVRLAFAVAAHLEPEILIVDEVLAVGDAEFQKKAIGKMKDVSNNSGRTVLFVSHNLGSIKSLCKRAIVLENGSISFEGSTKDAIDYYMDNRKNQLVSNDISMLPRSGGLGTDAKITTIKILNSNNKECSDIMYCEPFSIVLNVESKLSLKQVNVGIRFEDEENNSLTSTLSGESDHYYDCNDSTKIEIKYNDYRLIPGRYLITVSLRKNSIFIDEVVQCFAIDVLDVPYKNFKPHNKTWGKVKYFPVWS